MKLGTAKSFATAGVLLLSVASWSAQAETLEISGGAVPWADAIEPWLADIKAKGVEIKFNGVGTGRGVLALIDGKVGVASAGDTLEDSVKAAKKAAKAEGREITAPGNLVFSSIGIDEQRVIVHKSIP